MHRQAGLHHYNLGHAMPQARSNHARIAVILVIIGFVSTGLLAIFTPSPVARTAATLPHEAYVWQRRWDAPTRDAVVSHADSFDRLVVLAVEIEWRSNQPHVIRVPVDWSSLAASRRPVGAALRIGPFPGPFTSTGPVAKRIAAVAGQIITEARDAGVELTELQIDFDAASSKLAGYRTWVHNIRAESGDTPLVITALPAWLGRSGFAQLIEACDSYILQVHSLEAPDGPDDASPFCDPDRAVRWVERAARYGRPFRVALPTYGYLMAFDADGKFVGLSAEGPRVDWPRDGVVRRLDADPVAMASLIERWRTDRPMVMQGVIWYRLPTEADRQNWSWPTLASVMAGIAPRPFVTARARRVEPGLVEIDLANDGAADAPAAFAVYIRWHDEKLVAADALNGYALERIGDHAARLVPLGSAAGLRLDRLAPNAQRTLAWLRFDRDTEVHVDVQNFSNHR